jgi:hypothetical protein
MACADLNFFVGLSVLIVGGGGKGLPTTGKEQGNKPKSRREEKARLRSLWLEHNILFPTEEDCLNDILGRLEQWNAIKCSHCGSTDVKRDDDEDRTGTCRSCSNSVWLTAGTFFDHMRHVRAWHAAIWLKERGAIFNNKQFHELVGIAASSSWNILKRIEMVIQARMNSENGSVSSALFSAVYGRRSRMTPKDSHPRQEEDSMEHDRPDDRMTDCVNEPDLSPDEKELYDLLSEKPVHCDTLADRLQKSINDILSGLTMLELSGLVTASPGGRYAHANRASAVRLNYFSNANAGKTKSAGSGLVVKSIMEFIKHVFQSVSRKYVQLYAAAHWFHTEESTWGIDSLFRACVQFGDIRDDQILEYVSPSMITI